LGTVKRLSKQEALDLSYTKKAEPMLRFLVLKMQLPPMAFYHDPLPIAVFPAVSNPTLVLPGRTLIAAGRPNVMIAFIAMIAIDPYISTVRRRTAALVDGRRRADADRDLRQRSHRAQSESKQ
jgi:hypothetical protein